MPRLAACALVAAVTSTSAELVAPPPVVPREAPASTPLREQELDTDVPPIEPAPAPPPPKLTPRPRANRLVRTPRDEDLPSWCPVSGRLTVIEACDLAENLGLAPMGTARDGGCPSVAALLEEERLRQTNR